jgi:hypothetical protein
MPVSHTKEFGVYHWDTFDNETLFLDEFDTQKQAEDYVAEKYKGRIDSNGADQVDIVDSKGKIVRAYKVR